jgi:hypothetical protein
VAIHITVRLLTPTHISRGAEPARTTLAGTRQGHVSRVAVADRLVGMTRNAGRVARRWLTTLVLAHLFVTILHGAAHTEAHVRLSGAANVFVFVVILAGPVLGLGLSFGTERIGSWLIATTMAGSFVFGCVNHFVLSSPDQVWHVDAAWRPLFAATAVLLAVTEGLVSLLAIRVAREGKLG